MTLFRLNFGRPVRMETFEEKNAVFRVLVHGALSKKGWPTANDSKLHPGVKKALEDRNIRDLHALQQFAWPSINRRQDVVLIGRKTHGKRFAYIPPVVDIVLDTEKAKGHGPLAIILCPGYTQVEQVYRLCRSMVPPTHKNAVRVLMFHDSTISVKNTVQCLNGCEILVTTPRCLLGLLISSTNLKRLTVLVVDHAEILLPKFQTEVHKLVTLIKEVVRQRTEDDVVQVIASSEKWIPVLKAFTTHIPSNPVVLISDPLEAALYGQVQVSLQMVESRHKMQALLKILETEAGHQKLVVFCSSVEESVLLTETLKTNSYYVIQTWEDTPVEDLEHAKLQWRDSAPPNYPILVCTDAEFLLLNVRDATCLIHFSMRHDGTKSQFGARFSCLMDNYPSIFQECIAKPLTYVLLDETHDQQLRSVVHFILRGGEGTEENEDLKRIAKEHALKKEQEKVLMPLCHDIEMYGDCWFSQTCKYRHILLESDSPNLPNCGSVKLLILNVINACHLAARIVAYTDKDGNEQRWPNEYMNLGFRMLERFGDPSNIMPHGKPKVNDICAVKTTDDVFYRAIVTQIVEETIMSTTVHVRLLDEGTCVRKQAYELFLLPEDLQKVPPQAVDVFVCRLKPRDLDEDWSSNVNNRVEEWVQTVSDGRDMFFKGKIKMSLRDKLWVDPLEIIRYLESVQTHVVTRSIRRDLLDLNLAVSNPKHLDKLYALCEESGIKNAVPAFESKKPTRKVPKEQPVPQWAHLEMDVFEETYFVCGENPRLFFLRRLYTSKNFNTLMKDIQNIEKERVEDETYFYPGRLCLAFCEDDQQWGRAVIKSDLENKCVTVFFVDFGDVEKVSVNNIALIPDNIITVLPFQAIECGLVGISPNGSKWSAEATDLLYDLCKDDDKCLFARPVVTRSGVLTGGHQYLVVLVDTHGQTDVLINEVFLNNNVAVRNEEEDEYLEEPLNGKFSTVNSSLYTRDEAESEENISDEDSAEKDTTPLDSGEEEAPEVMIVNGLEVRLSEMDIKDYFMDWFEIPKTAPAALPTLPELTALPAPAALPSLPAPSSPSAQSGSPKVDSASAPKQKPWRRTRPALSSARSPSMRWSQDRYSIWIDIEPGVEIMDYYLRWSLNRIQFSARVGDKMYHADLKLCGTIFPEELTHCKQGLVIAIAAKKAYTGWYWPRLLEPSERHWWLKHDAADEFDSSDSDDDSITGKLVKRAKKSGGNLKKPSKAPLGKTMFDAALSSEGESSQDEETAQIANDNDDILFKLLHNSEGGSSPL